jgi:long-chain acyl-CoA synthetase
MPSNEISACLSRVFKENWSRDFLFGEELSKPMTYGHFYAGVAELRARLTAQGLKRGDKVCVVLPNSWRYPVLYLAAASLGVVLVPIDHSRGQTEIQDILKLAPCSLVLTKDDLSLFDGLPSKHVGPFPSEPWWEGLDGEGIFLIIFTSGTTGVPKGIKHSFRNLFLSAQAFAQRFDFSREHIFYHNLSMAYMAGILNLFVMPLICGSGIVIGERFTGSSILSFWQLPVKYKANTFWFIPTIAAMLLRMDRGAQGVDYAQQVNITGLIGTAPLSEQLKHDFEAKYNIKLYESYGLSETLFLTTNAPCDLGKEKSVGHALAGVAMSFREDGEIGVRVPWNFLGYVGQEGGQDPAGVFWTGDIGEKTSTGALKITGRKKDIIIRGGVNISPRRIEEMLMQEPAVDEAVVVGVKDQILGEKTVGVVVLKPSSGGTQSINKISWNAKIEAQLGRDYSIDDYKIVETIPKNLNGKTDKNKLVGLIEAGL